MPVATIIVPAFNVQNTISETLDSLLAQTYPAFEIVIVDDGSTDATAEIAARYARDCRVRVITQKNRGLAGARNTGIAAARGGFIGFCDADDLWRADKLSAHIAHLETDPMLGVSYSGSALIDDASAPLELAQNPRITGVTPGHILRRNPVGNGSAPVIRRCVFDAIAYRPAHETERDWYFDETFRQSEDIECWLRIALTTRYQFEGLPDLLTSYRVSSGGLSAATDRQLQAWERMIAKLTPLAPAFFAREVSGARAYQLRYLSRRAISDLDAPRAWNLTCQWLTQSRRPLWEEPAKSLTSIAASLALLAMGAPRATATANTIRNLKAGRRTKSISDFQTERKVKTGPVQ